MTPSPLAPEKSYRLVLMIWVALFASIAMDYLLVAAILQPAKTDPNPALVLPLLGLSILIVPASVYCRTRIGVTVQAGHIVALMLAVAPAELGVVVFAVSGCRGRGSFL
jgi:hypothetical protein